MSDCIEWEGIRLPSGYGRVYVSGRGMLLAHRWAYEQANGTIPPGLVVMHSCDNPPCVNTEHLSLGTHADNMRDMARKGRHVGNGWKHRTHCSKGHEYTPESTRTAKDGTRSCRECQRISQREYEARNPWRAKQNRKLKYKEKAGA